MRAFLLLGSEALQLVDYRVDFLKQHPPGSFQRVELAFASSDGDLLRAQLGLRLLHAGLQRNLFIQQRVFLSAPFAYPFLQSGQVSLQFGDLILPSENRRRRLAGTVAIQVAAGINSVPAEQFATQSDEIKRAIGLAPGCRGAGKVADNEGLAQQPLHQRLHSVVGFDNGKR